MKTVAAVHPVDPQFQPIELKIVVESQEEKNQLLAIFGTNVTVAEFVRKGDCRVTVSLAARLLSQMYIALKSVK